MVDNGLAPCYSSPMDKVPGKVPLRAILDSHCRCPTCERVLEEALVVAKELVMPLEEVREWTLELAFDIYVEPKGEE